MKKMWTLKNAAVAVLGALFLGGICKLGIFFSVMLVQTTSKKRALRFRF